MFSYFLLLLTHFLRNLIQTDSLSGFIRNCYEAVSQCVTERVLCEDKTHSTGLTKSDPDILVPNEPSWSQRSSLA